VLVKGIDVRCRLENFSCQTAPPCTICSSYLGVRTERISTTTILGGIEAVFDWKGSTSVQPLPTNRRHLRHLLSTWIQSTRLTLAESLGKNDGTEAKMIGTDNTGQKVHPQLPPPFVQWLPAHSTLPINSC